MGPLSKITEASLDALRARLTAVVSEKRYAHILAVEREVERIGPLFLDAEQQARLRAAALLHDAAKGYSEEEQKRLLDEAGVTLDPSEQQAPPVWHARITPYLIRTRYPAFAFEDILSAVDKHTAGDAQMSVFDKLLFLADYIEETRPQASCREIRVRFYRDMQGCETKTERERLLDGTVRDVLAATMTWLLSQGKPVSLASVEAYNSLL